MNKQGFYNFYDQNNLLSYPSYYPYNCIKTISKSRLQPINKPNYKYQTKKPQLKINKKRNFYEIINIIYHSGFLSSIYVFNNVYNDLKSNYYLNGDENEYKKSNIYKTIHDPNINKLKYGLSINNIELDDKLNFIEVLISLGAKVDYKTVYFEDSILYDFMHIIELYKLNVNYFYKYDVNINNFN